MVSEPDWHEIGIRHTARLRSCRIPLLFAFLLVAGNAARLLVGELGGGCDDPGRQVSRADAVPLAGGESRAAEIGAALAKVEQAESDVLDKEPVGDVKAPQNLAWASPSERVKAAEPAGPLRGAQISPSSKPLVETAAAADRVPGPPVIRQQSADPQRWAMPRGLLQMGQGFGQGAAAVRTAAGGRIRVYGETLAVVGEVLRSLPATGREDALAREACNVLTGNVVLVNPQETGGAVHFVLDEAVHTLRPGETHQRRCEGGCVIRFHRGDGFGNAEYTINDGVYRFGIGSGGWDLLRVSSGDLP